MTPHMTTTTMKLMVMVTAMMMEPIILVMVLRTSTMTCFQMGRCCLALLCACVFMIHQQAHAWSHHSVRRQHQYQQHQQLIHNGISAGVPRLHAHEEGVGQAQPLQGRSTSTPSSPLNAAKPTAKPTAPPSRRHVLSTAVSLTAALASGALPFGSGSTAAAVDLEYFTQSGRKTFDPRATITVQIESPTDKLGLQLADATLRQQPIVYIVGTAPFRSSAQLQPGLILLGYDSAVQVVQRIQSGPWPVTFTFFNLAAGGDAFNDMGQTMVTPMDALKLAKQTEGSAAADSTLTRIPASSNGSSSVTTKPATATTGTEFSIETIERPNPNKCLIQTRKGDLLEIEYEAAVLTGTTASQVYDSSLKRGTGQPYQMVLGSGDMIPGVDLALYEMCPGETRVVTIPPQLGYGPRASKLFRIPSNSSLRWTIKLISIEGIVREDSNDEFSRDDREQRALY